MHDWRSARLGDVALVNPMERLARGVDAPFIEMASVAGGLGGVRRVDVKPATGGARFRAGDTLVARITPCLENGKIARVPSLGDGVVGFGSTEFIVLRGDGKNTDSSFLSQFARWRAFRDHAEANLIGSSGRQRVSAEVLGNFIFDLPPLSEQQRIAGVLGAFDDLIETNLSIVTSIDRLGQTVAAETGRRIPDRAPLSEACAVIESGRRPKGGVKGIASGVPSIGAESVKGLGPFDFENTKFVPSAFAEGMRRGVVQDMDVLVYKDGGKPGEFYPHVSIVGCGYPYERMVINEHVFRVRGNPPLSQGFLYFWLSTPEMMARMKQAGSRTAAIPGMNGTNFGELPVPGADVPRSATEALDDLAAAALHLLSECRDLARQRDELLPLLMSGKVRVAELEGVA